MSKIKHRVTLKEGEACVVWTEETWCYIAGVFRQLSERYPESSEERMGWIDMADDVIEQCYESLNNPKDDEYDEWR